MRVVGAVWLAISTIAAGADAPAVATLVDLQAFKHSSSVSISGGGTATLVELNPQINAWYLLTLRWSDKDQPVEIYHLENPTPAIQRVMLSADGLDLVSNDQPTVPASHCPLWKAAPSSLVQARAIGLPYAPVCAGRLYLRNRVSGTQTHIEKITDFLRDHVAGGDDIVTFVRKEFFQDKFAETLKPGAEAASESAEVAGAPPRAQLRANADSQTIVAEHVDIDLGRARNLRLGHWYPVAKLQGVYLSAMQPQAIDPELLKRNRNRVNDLDSVESVAADYLVAFDLAQFDLGFVLGTDHPRLGWSPRVPAAVRNASPNHDLPGPDGIGSTAPLITNGMLSPALIATVAATFTGGFKREHGAFRYGALSQVNSGSHYGFVEQGTLFSTLQPGLATLYVTADGAVGMKTWTPQDNALLPSLRFARQNGVALIESEGADAAAVPGPLVARWGDGNWSGSADEKLRSLRAGACLIETETQRFLVYGYFSTATPSAMARVFQAYGCHYAMHLDMNAPEHTYLALYVRDDAKPRDSGMQVQHLIDEMAQVDRKGGDQFAPRFLNFPDDRDFFYLVRRTPSP